MPMYCLCVVLYMQLKKGLFIFYMNMENSSDIVETFFKKNKYI